MKIGTRAVMAALGLAAVMAAPGAAAAEQVYELTINNWAASDNGEMDVTWRIRLNPAGTRTSTSVVGTICMDGGSWEWKDAQQPRQIWYLKSKSDRVNGVARVRAVGSWTGARQARFWAVMGTQCGRASSAESNLVTRQLNR